MSNEVEPIQWTKEDQAAYDFHVNMLKQYKEWATAHLGIPEHLMGKPESTSPTTIFNQQS